MTSNQLASMPLVPEDGPPLSALGTGLAAQLAGPIRLTSATFSARGPTATGERPARSAGSIPTADAFLVLFTTQPGGDDGRYLARFSNAAAAALT